MKNKWITALTIKHLKKPWESFQYCYMDIRCTFERTRFEAMFMGAEKTWRVVVTRRNLERLYMLVAQHQMEWILADKRDFAEVGKPIILRILAYEVKLGK